MEKMWVSLVKLLSVLWSISPPETLLCKKKQQNYNHDFWWTPSEPQPENWTICTHFLKAWQCSVKAGDCQKQSNRLNHLSVFEYNSSFALGSTMNKLSCFPWEISLSGRQFSYQENHNLQTKAYCCPKLGTGSLLWNKCRIQYLKSH